MPPEVMRAPSDRRTGVVTATGLHRALACDPALHASAHDIRSIAGASRQVMIRHDAALVQIAWIGAAGPSNSRPTDSRRDGRRQLGRERQCDVTYGRRGCRTNLSSSEGWPRAAKVAVGSWRSCTFELYNARDRREH
jgi:hypothetical protein